MILLEVSKIFTNHGRLLGWNLNRTPTSKRKSAYLTLLSTPSNPTKDEKLLVSSRLDSKTELQEKAEDQTNKNLCRPLPVDKLPLPRVEPPGYSVIWTYLIGILVVGSATWAQKKKAHKPTAEGFKNSWDDEMTIGQTGIATSPPNKSRPKSPCGVWQE